MREQVCGIAALLVLVALLAAAEAADPRSPVWDIVPTWTSPPNVEGLPMPDGPLMGNGGSVGVVVGGSPEGERATFYIAKNDFWATSISGFSHFGYGDGGLRQLGGIDVTVPDLIANNASVVYEAKQFMGNGSVFTKHVSQRGDGLSLVTQSCVNRYAPIMATKITLSAAAGRTPSVVLAVRPWTVNDYLPVSTGYRSSPPSGEQAKRWTPKKGTKASSDRARNLSGEGAAKVTDIFVSRTSGWPFQHNPRSAVMPPPIINEAVIVSRLVWDNGTAVAAQNVSVTDDFVLMLAQVPANGQTMYLITYVASNGDQPSNIYYDPLADALKALSYHTPKTIEFLLATTADWWWNYWNASSIYWPSDPLTMNYWYGSQYVSALISRKGAVAPGLYGAFVTMDGLPFTGDFTLNYNFQSPYYATASSNHPDLMLPFFDVILDFMNNGRSMAQSYFNCPGVHYPGHIGPWGMISSDVGDMGQRSNAAFAAVIFAHYYMYTLDAVWLNQTTGYLGNTPYQFMTAVADFWLCYLQKNYTQSGYTYNSISDCTYELCGATEMHYDVNPTSTLSFLRYLFDTLIIIENYNQQVLSKQEGLHAMMEAKISRERVNLYSDVLENLAPYALGTDVINGRNVTVFQASYNIPPQPPGGNPLDTYALWPAGTAGPLSPTMKQIARDTVERDMSWSSGNAFPQIFPAAVRAGYNVAILMDYWHSTLSSICGTNLYCSINHAGIEGLGSIGTVNEMLLQSHEGYIKLFPLVPPETAITFTTLRAMNATLVSASIDVTGKVYNLVVTSLQGAPIVLYNPWPLMKAVGICYYGTQTCEQIVCLPPAPGLCTFIPEKGQTYQIYPFPTSS